MNEAQVLATLDAIRDCVYDGTDDAARNTQLWLVIASALADTVLKEMQGKTSSVSAVLFQQLCVDQTVSCEEAPAALCGLSHDAKQTLRNALVDYQYNPRIDMHEMVLVGEAIDLLIDAEHA
jgi:hypothetical protein